MSHLSKNYNFRLLCTLIILSGLASLISCEKGIKQDNVSNVQTDSSAILEIDTTPRVTGIGGIFFRSPDPKASMNWYEQNLGLKTDPYGAVFESRNSLNSDELNYLRWSPHALESELEPSTSNFMINYRVYNLEALLEQMRKNGVKVVDSVQVFDYGKFVHVLDADGSKIELWEPIDSALTELGGPVNK